MERTWVIDAVWIVLALLLVIANGFFVAAEFALVKVRQGRLEQLARQRRPFARTALWLWQRMDKSLSACQLGITMASLALGWIGEPAVAHLMEPVFRALGITSPAVIHGLAFAIGFTIITAAHLTLGEQAPKIFAIRNPEPMAIWCALPLRAFYLVSYPLLRGLDATTSAMLRLVGERGMSEHETPHTEEELRALVSQSHAHGELTRTEQRLVEAVFEFDDTICRQIMLPRTQVDWLDVEAPLAESLRIVKQTMHTRYPLCQGSLDNVLGIVHAKELVGVSAEDGFDLRTVMRPPKYVPELMRISRLLGHFQATKQHLAMVVDEYGTVVGIVSMENVLERIVGAVQDEFDSETPDIVPEGPGRFLVDGGASIGVVGRALELDFDARGVDTIGGLMLLRLGRLPVAGDRVELEGASAEILEVRNNRATRIRFVMQQQEAGLPGPAGS